MSNNKNVDIETWFQRRRDGGGEHDADSTAPPPLPFAPSDAELGMTPFAYRRPTAPAPWASVPHQSVSFEDVLSEQGRRPIPNNSVYSDANHWQHDARGLSADPKSTRAVIGGGTPVGEALRGHHDNKPTPTPSATQPRSSWSAVASSAPKPRSGQAAAARGGRSGQPARDTARAGEHNTRPTSGKGKGAGTSAVTDGERVRSRRNKHKPKTGETMAIGLFDLLEAPVGARVTAKVAMASSVKPTKEAKPVVQTTASGHVVQRRGKEREVAKKKRKSKLKQIILARRPGGEEEGGNDSAVTDDDGATLETGHEESGEEEQDGTDATVSQGPNTKKSKPVKGQGPSEPRTFATDSIRNQRISPDLNAEVKSVLVEVARFDKRGHEMNPVKHSAKRRLVCGLREVLKAVTLKKAKCVVVATTIEDIDGPDGLNDTLRNISDQAEEHGIPVVYAMSRRKLALVVGRGARKISACAILSHDGVYEAFQKMLKSAEALRVPNNQEVDRQLEGGEEQSTVPTQDDNGPTDITSTVSVT